jgi:hypothetical protein
MELIQHIVAAVVLAGVAGAFILMAWADAHTS